MRRAHRGSLCVPRGYQNAFLGIKLNLNLVEAHIRLCMKYELLILGFPDAVDVLILLVWNWCRSYAYVRMVVL